MSYLDEGNSKMATKTFNYLGNKSFKLHFLQRKRKNSEEEKRKLKEDSCLLLGRNCNFKLKRNKIRNSKLKRRTKLNLVNLMSEKPRAPHNTSSFLIENFFHHNGKLENSFKDIPLIETCDTFDEIYITPGSMKGIFILTLDMLCSDDYFHFTERAEKERDRISIHSTEYSLNDSEEKSFQGCESPFPYKIYEYS